MTKNNIKYCSSFFFIVFLSFSSSVGWVAKISDRTECLFLNHGTCMVRPTLIDFNPVELKHYSFIIS